MGMEMESDTGGAASSAATGSLEDRPGILLVGSLNVGKRTLLSRLLSIEIPDTHDLSSGVLCQGWTIETKYYSADLSIWTAHLVDGLSLNSIPNSEQLAALVMVFDMNDESSLLTLKNWVSGTDINFFEILLCIGNKVDLVPGHPAHTEYRRRMEKHGDFGINEDEGCSLLRDELEIEESIIEIRKSSLEWCTENGIEYIEACASNSAFDKCLSVDGDIQGVDRLIGALSTHMWPGLILKSGDRITAPSLPQKEESTDEEPEYEIDYEVLSHGSDEPWYNFDEPAGTSKQEQGEVEFSDFAAAAASASTSHTNDLNSVIAVTENGETARDEVDGREGTGVAVTRATELFGGGGDDDDDELYGLDDVERLMSEIGNVRDNLRLMPDFQRREMAAKLALRMAAMFGASSDDEA